MNDRGMYDWNGSNKTYQTSILYYCERPGWGYPSNGQSQKINYCQADKTWNLTAVEECVLLPCPKPPPEVPVGGWHWYDLEFTKYKCPNGHMFANGNYPYWYSNCTVSKIWDPLETENCMRKISSLIPNLYIKE